MSERGGPARRGDSDAGEAVTVTCGACRGEGRVGPIGSFYYTCGACGGAGKCPADPDGDR